MSASNSASSFTQQSNLLSTCCEVHPTANVPQNMRDKYYFCLLLSNLNLCTTTDGLKSVFKSLPGFIHASADVDTAGKPTGTGEVIFADETTMLAAAQHMNNQMIDGEKISVSELTLFDVKPEFFQRGGG